MTDPAAFESRTLPSGERLARWGTLWIDGDPRALRPPLVALIGTRDADPAGAALARRLAHDLARADVGVLSGGALGVDAAAHKGAVAAGGRTVVVLPSGLGHWYPKRHERLYREVLASGGALVSQFPPETPPSRWTFPKRNELVATLADVVVVVQAPASSGALMAAECAQRLGRRVMAVPASPTERRGAGCLRLLRAGALPCVGVDDVLAALASDGPLDAHARAQTTRQKAPREKRPRPREAPLFPDDAPAAEALDDPTRLVFEALSATPRHADELTRLTGLAASQIQQSLLTLVLNGAAADRGGGRFARS